MHELGIAAHRVGCGDDGACVAAEAARDVAYLFLELREFTGREIDAGPRISAARNPSPRR
jgi:hypothetical protein